MLGTTPLKLKPVDAHGWYGRTWRTTEQPIVREWRDAGCWLPTASGNVLSHYPQIEDPDAFADAALRLLTQSAAGQLKKFVTAVARSGDADVARFW